MENTVRVFYVVAIRDKDTGKVHIDTEIVDSTSAAAATAYLKESFAEGDFELLDYRVAKMSDARSAVVWLKK